jgi:post-segregation antitoxin (ccd killing protein)
MVTANVTVSLDPSVISLAKQRAQAEGVSMSAWVARTIRAATVAEAARRYEEFDRAAGDASLMTGWDNAHPSGQRLAGAEW